MLCEFHPKALIKYKNIYTYIHTVVYGQRGYMMVGGGRESERCRETNKFLLILNIKMKNYI